MLFEIAARRKFRFDSVRGSLTAEDLWDVPLRGTKVNPAFSLDEIAKNINRQLKETSEESFVDQPSDEKTLQNDLQNALDLVKHIIKVKSEEEDKVKKSRENRERKQQLLKLLKEKQEEDLRGKSIEEITKLINELED